MKSNTIIILLSVIATLLLVNLIQNRIPPTAQAAIGAHEWTIGCPAQIGVCYAINMDGAVHRITTKGKVEHIGTLQ